MALTDHRALQMCLFGDIAALGIYFPQLSRQLPQDIPGSALVGVARYAPAARTPLAADS